MQLDGARVRYVDEGQGPPVVLIHGFASSLDAWATVTPELVKRHRVIALDLKGFGWSDRPEGDYSPRAQATLVVQLLDRLGVKRAAVVAHSWGSSVALALALMAPDRVSRIALYDAWVYEEQLPTTFLWARAGWHGRGPLRHVLHGASGRESRARVPRPALRDRGARRDGRGSDLATRHDGGSPRRGARPALRGDAEALPRDPAAGLADLGSRGSGDAARVRRAPLARPSPTPSSRSTRSAGTSR